jgi:hypothetical protein
MFLTGRVKVRWLRLHEVQGFLMSFDYTTPKWISFYRERNQPDEADSLMRKQWATARASGGLVDELGAIIAAEDVLKLAPARIQTLNQLGDLWLRGLKYHEVLDAAQHLSSVPAVAFDEPVSLDALALPQTVEPALVPSADTATEVSATPATPMVVVSEVSMDRSHSDTGRAVVPTSPDSQVNTVQGADIEADFVLMLPDLLALGPPAQSALDASGITVDRIQSAEVLSSRFLPAAQAITDVLANAREANLRAELAPLLREQARVQKLTEMSWLDRMVHSARFWASDDEEEEEETEFLPEPADSIADILHQVSSSQRAGLLLASAAIELAEHSIGSRCTPITMPSSAFHALIKRAASGTSISRLLPLQSTPVVVHKFEKISEYTPWYKSALPASKPHARLSAIPSGDTLQQMLLHQRQALVTFAELLFPSVQRGFNQAFGNANAQERFHPEILSPMTVAHSEAHNDSDNILQSTEHVSPLPTRITKSHDEDGCPSIDLVEVQLADAHVAHGTNWPPNTTRTVRVTGGTPIPAMVVPQPSATSADMSQEAELHSHIRFLRHSLRELYGNHWDAVTPGVPASSTVYGSLHPLLPPPIQLTRMCVASKTAHESLRALDYADSTRSRTSLQACAPFMADFLRLPLFAPSWFIEDSRTAPRPLSMKSWAYWRALTRHFPDSAVLDGQHAVSMMSCLGVLNFRRPAITLGAVRLQSADASLDGGNSSAAGTDDMMYLLPVAHPKRIRQAFRGRKDVQQGQPSVFTGYGSGVYYHNACERLRLQIQDAVRATAPLASEPDAFVMNIGPAEARMQIAIPQSRFLEEEMSYMYGSDELMGPPPSQVPHALSNARLRAVADKLQQSRSVKAYALGDTRPSRSQGIAGALDGDFLRRVRVRILGKAAYAGDPDTPASPGADLQPPIDIPGFGPPARIGRRVEGLPEHED